MMWDGDASTGEQLQIQIIISREVWLHRDHNKSIAWRHIKTLSVSGKWKQAQVILHYGELYNYFIICYNVIIIEIGTSLVAQWLRIHLPRQGTRVRALVREDPTCRGATKPVRHNYWAPVPQLLKPARLEPVLHNKRSHHKEKPAQQRRLIAANK